MRTPTNFSRRALPTADRWRRQPLWFDCVNPYPSSLPLPSRVLFGVLGRSRAINESMISGKKFLARMFASNFFSEIMRIETSRSRAGAPRCTEQSARFRYDQRAKKKSVIDGRASSEGVNTPTGGDARPAMMRINKRAGRENEQQNSKTAKQQTSKPANQQTSKTHPTYAIHRRFCRE